MVSSNSDRYRQRQQQHRQERQQQQQQQQQQPGTLEVSPGTFLKYRGADETWACIEQDFYRFNTCFGCSTDVCCIQDADFYVCPTCRTIAPISSSSSSRGNNSSSSRNSSTGGGVALGFTIEQLFKWQTEIVRGASNRTRQQQQQQQDQEEEQLLQEQQIREMKQLQLQQQQSIIVEELLAADSAAAAWNNPATAR